MKELTWGQITRVTKELAVSIENTFWKPDVIVAIANGGVIPAMMLLNQLETAFEEKPQFRIYDLKIRKQQYFNYQYDYLFVDDIYDSGKTFQKIYPKLPNDNHNKFRFAFLYSRKKLDNEIFYVGQTLDHPHWLHFPWEK